MRVRDPFAGRAHDAAEHFRLSFYGALLLLQEIAPDWALPPSYEQELAAARLNGDSARAMRLDWDARLARWEDAGRAWLPLAGLRTAIGVDALGTALLMLCGLPDEDARLGRPTLGLLTACWDDAGERVRARRALARLAECGLVDAAGPDGVLHADPQVWGVLRGEPAPGHVAVHDLPALDTLILPASAESRAAAAAAWLRDGRGGHLVLRGAEGSGRRTLARAVARAAGLGVLEVEGTAAASAGALAVLLGAIPVVSPAEDPSELVLAPRLAAWSGAVVLRVPAGRAVAGSAGAFTLDLGVPDAACRARHWGEALEGLSLAHEPTALEALALAHRMTGGTIRRVAPGAALEAAAAGRGQITPADVTRAARAVRAEVPSSLATRLEVAGSWDDVVVSAATREELRTLERRCRRRERLPAMLPPTLASGVGPGVRALFTGPSGTGKTLSARLLAAVLGKDLYRLDLAGVVNKYLGETEKNLDRVLEHAEAIDAVLLIDEGDALLARRTDIQSANDRYANLETNYLLQRLESFEGIVVITTNAEQHLDAAFERRLDVVVEFPAPGPAERQALWQAHLPPDHRTPDALLSEAAARCAMTGGQVRNAVLHASLLAIDDDEPVGARQVVAAVRREYAKLGAVCPLRGHG